MDFDKAWMEGKILHFTFPGINAMNTNMSE